MKNSYTKFLLDNTSMGLGNGFTDEFRAEMWTQLMRACVSVYRELLLLHHWIVMSYCGFSKILKKVSQPISSAAPDTIVALLLHAHLAIGCSNV
jgi:hypothetical protein